MARPWLRAAPTRRSSSGTPPRSCSDKEIVTGGGLNAYGVLGKSCPWGAMLSRVLGWEGEASPPTAKACSPRGEAMLSRWDLKVACPRKTAAKAWHPADIPFPGGYSH